MSPLKNRLFFHQNIFWFFILSLVAKFTLFVRQRDSSQFIAIDLNALFEIFIIFGCFFYLCLLPNKKNTLKSLFYAPSKYFVMYYSFCLLSTTWSTMAVFSGFRAFEVIVIIFIVFYVISLYDNYFRKEIIYIRIISVFILFYFIMHLRLFNMEFSWRSFHTNTYSSIAGMGFLYCFGELLYAQGVRKKHLLGLSIMFFSCLIIGTSSASNISVAIGFIVLLLCAGKNKILVLFFLVILSLILYFTGEIDDFLLNILLPNKTNEDIITLRGRTVLWETYLKMFNMSPIIGNGFAVSARIASQFGGRSATNTHNGIFEILLGTGVSGLCFYILWLISIIKKLTFDIQNRRIGAFGFLGAFTVLMINNLALSIIGGALNPVLISGVLLLALFSNNITISEKDINANNLRFWPKILW